jgi:hypothetical protein
MICGDRTAPNSRRASRDLCRDKRVNDSKRWLSNRWIARSYSICRQNIVLRNDWRAYDWASRNDVRGRKRIILCKCDRLNDWSARRYIVGVKLKIFNKPTVCQRHRC